MSEIIAKVAKIAQLVVVAGFVAIFIWGALMSLGSVLDEYGLGSIEAEVTGWLLTGRELANNFIPAESFNACIGLWIAGSSLLLADYIVTIIGGKLANLR